MRSKRIMALLLALVMMFSLAGCGEKTQPTNAPTDAPKATEAPTAGATDAPTEAPTEAPAVDTSKHVDLSWYVSIKTSDDMEEVFAEANKIFNDKINADVEFNFLGGSTAYTTNMNLMIGTQEEFDICYTDNWSLLYSDCVAQGGFLDITDMLQTVTPELWAAIPEEAWDACRINGRIYGIPNTQQWARSAGYLYNAKYYEEYDGKSVDSLGDLADYIIRVSEGEAAKGNKWDAQASGTKDWMYDYCQTVGWEFIGGQQIPGLANGTEEHPTVFNQFLTDEYKEIIQAKAKLYVAGCIPSDILTSSTSYPVSNQIACFENLGMSDEAEQQNTKVDWEGVVLIRPGISLLTTDSVTATMTAVSATSKNPERALLAIQEMYFNGELLDLMKLGIKDKHYTVDDQGRYTKVSGSAYTGVSYKMGCTFSGMLPSSYEDLDRWERTVEWNANAVPSALLGFNYDTSKCPTEITNCQAVVNEYHKIFMAGAYGEDTMKYYEEFIDKLEAAGVDTVIADKQAQIDAFLASK